VDISSTRDLDNTNPEGPEDYPIGLASTGFLALMAHSGPRLEVLDVASCRHISHEAFAEIFDGVKQYPFLREINMSFCPVVDTQVVAGIFRSCPRVKKVVTFGCFEVQDVIVPRGIVLIGAPKAHDTIEQFGDTVMDFQKVLQEEMSADRAMGRIVPVMG
jgi:DNA repair protein RAD7